MPPLLSGTSSGDPGHQYAARYWWPYFYGVFYLGAPYKKTGAADPIRGNNWNVFRCPTDSRKNNLRLSYVAARTWVDPRGTAAPLKTTEVKMPSRAYLIMDADYNHTAVAKGLTTAEHSKARRSGPPVQLASVLHRICMKLVRFIWGVPVFHIWMAMWHPGSTGRDWITNTPACTKIFCSMNRIVSELTAVQWMINGNQKKEDDNEIFTRGLICSVVGLSVCL